MTTHLGFTRHGTGPQPVLVLHDWFGDHTSWEPTLPYLDGERYAYLFADLRGYGLSRAIAGEYTLAEAATDALALLDRLGISRFALVGHSMSSLVVQRIAQLAPERTAAVVAVTPVPPTSLGIDEAAVASLRALALGTDEERIATLTTWWRPRLSARWVRFKVERWRATADPEAVADYVRLYGQTDIAAGARAVTAPLLVVTGADDAPHFGAEALTRTMLPYYPQARLVTLAGSGHYPMQEQPPAFATAIEGFLEEALPSGV
jgi:3-oxoadipate enol-lactonase